MEKDPKNPKKKKLDLVLRKIRDLTAEEADFVVGGSNGSPSNPSGNSTPTRPTNSRPPVNEV